VVQIKPGSGIGKNIRGILKFYMVTNLSVEQVDGTVSGSLWETFLLVMSDCLNKIS
jgi:hypothetical protein